MVETQDFTFLADALDAGDHSVLPILADYLEEQGRDTTILRQHTGIPIGVAEDGKSEEVGSPMYYWHRLINNSIMQDGKLVSEDIFPLLVAEIRYVLVPHVAYFSSISMAFMALVHAAERKVNE